jgi:hypothetical protein
LTISPDISSKHRDVANLENAGAVAEEQISAHAVVRDLRVNKAFYDDFH